MRRGRRVVLATVVAAVAWLGTVAAASAAPAAIEGDWSYAGGIVTVAPAAGGGFTGTVSRTGSQQCAGSPGEVVWQSIAATQGDPQRFTGEHSWVQASTCALSGYFPATFVVAADGQRMEVCTTNPSAGQVCRTYERSGTAPTQPAVTCASRGPVYGEQRVGNAVAAGCWVDVSPGVYSTTQAARIGGFTVLADARRRGARDRHEAQDRARDRRDARVARRERRRPARLRPRRPARRPPRGRTAARRAAVARRRPARPGSRVAWTADGRGATLTGGVAWANLPAALRDKVAARIGIRKLPKGEGSLTIKLDNVGGFSVGGVEAKLSDLAFPTPFVPLVLKSVSAKLEQPDPAKPGLRWRFEGQLETPVGCAQRPGEETSCIEVRAIVYLADGGPVGGGVGLDNLDIPIGGTPLKLQGLAGEIVFKPSPGLALSGNGTLGGRIRGVDRGELFNLTATLAVLSLATQGSDPCFTPVKLSASASLPALEAAGGRAELGLKLCFTGFGQRTALTEVGGTLDIGLPFDLASFRGTGNGWYSPHAFSITGTSGVKIRRYPVAGGSYVLSNVAAAACASVGWIEVGAVWRWSGRGQAWNSCDLTAFVPQRPKARRRGRRRCGSRPGSARSRSACAERRRARDPAHRPGRGGGRHRGGGAARDRPADRRPRRRALRHDGHPAAAARRDVADRVAAAGGRRGHRAGQAAAAPAGARTRRGRPPPARLAAHAARR